jgi:hypothetical protein
MQTPVALEASDDEDAYRIAVPPPGVIYIKPEPVDASDDDPVLASSSGVAPSPAPVEAGHPVSMEDGYHPGIFTVDRILARSTQREVGPGGVVGFKLLVRWAGYGPEDDTWEMERELRQTAPDAVAEFKKRGESMSFLRVRASAHSGL